MGVRKDEEKAKQLVVLARKRGVVGKWVRNQEKGTWKLSVE